MLVASALKLKPFGRQKKVAILGSTGSIGQSTLEVIRNNTELFKVHTLVAGSNYQLLSKQVAEFKPEYAGLNFSNNTNRPDLSNCKFVFGSEAICELVANPDIDLVVAAISGNFGLASTLAAVKAGKVIALANKESLVCAGQYIKELMQTSCSSIIPVDSEHSALFQALQGECFDNVHELILTASGGPFLNISKNELAAVTPEQALKHPRWQMGPKVTIDSATLMNKALEVIEAHWLFGVSPDRIQVVVHPQSIVHSLVSFCDGSQIAQLSETLMLGPIAYALSFPSGRLNKTMPQLSLAKVAKLDFFELDSERFPAVNIAKQCLLNGQVAQIIFSVANEVAVRKFMQKELSFTGIYNLVENSLSRYGSRTLPELSELVEFIHELDREIEKDYK